MHPLKKHCPKDNQTDGMPGKDVASNLSEEHANFQTNGFTEKQTNSNKEVHTDNNSKEVTLSDKQAEESDWSEDESDVSSRPLGSSDTLLYPSSFDEYDGQHSYSLAPSEGNQPIPIFQEDLEELAFPTIFCGETRPNQKERKIPVKYSDICKAELRNKDRRVALNVNNLFFKLKKIQVKQIQDRIWLSMKRCKTKGKTYTAGDFKHGNAAEEIAKLDEGYKIFRCLRGSPPYWESAKKDIFSMIRQLGTPTWFFSLSAAETRWSSLLFTLGRLVDNKEYTMEEISAMPWETKCRLIRSDPVTCARHFQHRVDSFLGTVLNSNSSPLGKAEDHFYRIEFQQRGSPHIHGLLWIANAPHIGTDEDQKVEQYIASHVTTQKEGPCSADLIKLQSHRHSHSCKKNKQKACRFDFPLPPMRSTRLLKPFRDPTDPGFKVAKQNYCKILACLEKISSGSDMTFTEYLRDLGMSEEEYIMALRKSIRDVKVFHQREPDAVRINAYNPHILEAWQANCDLQFVTSPYACGNYIVGYISKGQRGMSDLLRHACEEARKDGGTIQNQVRSIGNKFNRHVEISEQEAVYLVLQMPLRKSSRGYFFINTSPPEERPFLLKSSADLELLDDDSEDIQCQNMLSRYTKRPKSVKHLCLADFCSMYDIRRYRKKGKSQKFVGNGEIPESDMEDNCDDDPDNEANSLQAGEMKLMDGTIMKKRMEKKIIRFVRYSKQKDPENFYREQLLLFHPWFKEDQLLGEFATYEEAYTEMSDMILAKRAEYEYSEADSEELNQIEEQLLNDQDDDAWDQIAPVTQHKERADRKKSLTDLERDKEFSRDYDFGTDLGLPGGSDIHEELIRNRMEDDKYRHLVQSLNKEQKAIFLHILKMAKDNEEQHYIFLSGGAGVGKTRVTKAIYQALLRIFNTSPDSHPEQTSVLLTAPTGKAAYLIKGQTIHSAFGVPANQGYSYKMLPLDRLNSLRCKYAGLKWLIIDEISMCGSNLFNFINLRLQEVMGTKKAFGGISVIAIGDLFQLNPVKDKWIFEQPNQDYSILAPNIWIENFALYELEKIMRQLEDVPFSEALNRLREGKHTPLDIQLLKTRKVEPDSIYPKSATHLMYRNADVDSHNNTVYHTTDSVKAEVEATDIVIGDVTSEVAKQIKAKAPIRSGDSMGLGKYFTTAVSLRNEMTVNVDVEDGLVNGAACVTKYIEFSPATGKPEVIWVCFEDPEVGAKLRRESRHLYNKKIEENWTPIRQVSREFPVGRYKCAKLRRSQFPLQLACAKTVHRSQGDTLPQVVVKLPDQRRMHMHYVAFSRATSLNNLYILGGFDQSNITACPKVRNEMNRLRTGAQLHLCFKPLYTFGDGYVKIVFHNCQSLRLHIADILADFSFNSSDICMFVETKLCERDDANTFALQGYDMFRNDFSKNRTAYGSAVYKQKALTAYITSANYKRIEFTIALVSMPVQQLQVVCVYIRPTESVQDIQKALQNLTMKLNSEEPVVVMGDFNINCLEHSPKYDAICRIFNLLNCRQILNEYTTNGRTCIDLIFTNLHDTDIASGVLESYFSYHKPVYMCIRKSVALLTA